MACDLSTRLSERMFSLNSLSADQHGLVQLLGTVPFYFQKRLGSIRLTSKLRIVYVRKNNRCNKFFITITKFLGSLRSIFKFTHTCLHVCITHRETWFIILLIKNPDFVLYYFQIEWTMLFNLSLISIFFSYLIKLKCYRSVLSVGHILGFCKY